MCSLGGRWREGSSDMLVKIVKKRGNQSNGQKKIDLDQSAKPRDLVQLPVTADLVPKEIFPSVKF